ncbi:MAG: hypothetical protein LBP79_03370 [Clostridiales bacterium]|jgi:hypothetical protein|nr:hypothetical protein [Clostridiales bacterium]
MPKKNVKVILGFIPLAGALAALLLAEFSVIDKSGAQYLAIAALLIINVALYSVSRFKSGGVTLYFILNALTAVVFQSVAVNIAKFYAPHNAGIWERSHTGAFLTFFVYYAVGAVVGLTCKKGDGRADGSAAVFGDTKKRANNGYIKEAVLYLLLSSVYFFNVYASPAGISFVASNLAGNFVWSFISVALMFFCISEPRFRAGKITASVLAFGAAGLYVLYALCALFPTGAGTIKIIFYALYFALLILWFVHAVSAYNFFGLNTQTVECVGGPKKDGVKYAVLSLMPVIMFMQYIFNGVDGALFGVEPDGIAGLFIKVETDNAALLYGVVAVLISARILFAASAFLFFKKDIIPSKKSAENTGETEAEEIKKKGTDELGIDLSFEETLKKRNIDVSDMRNAALDAILPHAERQVRTAEQSPAAPIPQATRQSVTQRSQTVLPATPKPQTAQPVMSGSERDLSRTVSFRISETLSDGGLKEAIRTLIDGNAASAPSRANADASEIYAGGLPISVAYDIGQLKNRAAAADDEESRKIDEILERINKEIEK